MLYFATAEVQSGREGKKGIRANTRKARIMTHKRNKIMFVPVRHSVSATLSHHVQLLTPPVSYSTPTGRSSIDPISSPRGIHQRKFARRTGEGL